MTTFAGWLKDQTEASSTPAIRWLAGEWTGALHRPRVSTPSGIEKHLAEVHAGDETYIGQLATAVRIATDAYHHRDDPPSDDQQLAAVAAGEMTPAEHLATNELAAADQDVPEDQFDGDPEPGALLVALVQGQLMTERRLELMYGLLRSMGAAIGLNVDDASIEAMAELWGVLPGAGQLITDSADESLAAQLAQPTPPNAFSTWWGTADHNAPADGTAAG